MQSGARGTPTLVVLHGHGDDDAATRSWAHAVAPPGWRIEFPVSVSGSEERSWFDTGPRGVVAPTLQRSCDLVAAVVSTAAEHGPVALAGFSQGAAMALALGDLPGLVGVVGICAFLAETDDTDLGRGPAALLLGGSEDQVVPAFLAEDAAAAMSASGRQVTSETLRGDHRVTDTAAARARAWLGSRCPSRLRVSLGLPVDRVDTGRELVSGEAIEEMATAWEAFGFAAAYVTDHPAPDDRWLAAGGHHALEPTVALTAAAAATSSLLLHTHVYILGYRNPFISAKALGSLDVLSGGRLILGVAAGYLRAEFEAVGADFEQRGEVLDTTLELLSRIWCETGMAAEGDGWSARSVTALPRPSQRPHPPLWVGGNSVRAMRRAVRFGQGWSPFPTPGGLDRATRTAAIVDQADLAARIAKLDELCDQAERSDRPTVCFSPFGLADYLADPDGSVGALAMEAGELWDMGVDWLALSVPGLGRAEVIDRAGRLADELGLSAP